MWILNMGMIDKIRVTVSTTEKDEKA